jgi:hypothetical protein
MGTLHEFEVRLRAAERRSTLMGWVAAASALLSITALGSRPASSNARGTSLPAPFRVVDGNGKALLEVTDDGGGPALRLFTATGLPAAEITASRKRGALTLRNTDGNPVIGMDSDDYGGGRFNLANEAGKRSVRLLGHSRGGQVEVWSELGKEAIVLQSHVVGNTIEVYDREGEEAATLYSTAQREGGLQVHRGGTRTGAALQSGDDGCSLTIRNAGDSGGLALSANTEGGRVELFRGQRTRWTKGVSLRTTGDGGMLELFGSAGEPSFTKP